MTSPRKARDCKCIPLVRFFFTEIERRNMAYSKVATITGLASSCIHQWKTGTTPGLGVFEAALNAIGLELVIQSRGGNHASQQNLRNEG